MKRVYIACVILITCLALSIFSYSTITKDSKALIAEAREIEKLLETGNFEKIEKDSKILKEDWKKFSLPFSLLTTHIHFDTLEECVDSLYHASKTKKEDEIKKACNDLIFEATHIITSINPKAENVF